MNKLTAVIVPVQDKPYIAQIENSLKSLQALVGGYIETVPHGNGLMAICNEEGRIIGLPINNHLRNFVGTVIIVSNHIAGDGELTGLTDDKACQVLESLY